MTDLDATKAMLDRAGVFYSVDITPTATTLQITSRRGKANRGYNGFFTDMEFNKSGALVSVGAWEG